MQRQPTVVTTTGLSSKVAKSSAVWWTSMALGITRNVLPKKVLHWDGTATGAGQPKSTDSSADFKVASGREGVL
ncbi:rCG51334 [Rattus norvegicus]|uniref:RCG51334 n=1 Tax=Rattus norvegicus TaxID=10116 RepID=A6IZG7_RAT|nr:rCG51334 [Rattus norvegicus]